MDRDSGRIYEMNTPLSDALRDAGVQLESFDRGERVQIKGCWFEVMKVLTRKQRLVLKPIPAPANPVAASRSASLDELSAEIDAREEKP